MAMQEEMGAMRDMMNMLAEAPEERRREMMKERMTMFLSMPEEQRTAGMRDMLVILHDMNDEKLTSMVNSRTYCMCQFSDADRKTLMSTHMKALIGLPEAAHMKEMTKIEESIKALPPDLAAAAMKTMEEVQGAQM